MMKKNNEFIKFDTHKLRYDLIPPKVLKELAKVLTYGSKKYSDNNWKKCKDINHYVGALYRHLESWRTGEIVDKESGLDHLSCVLANASFLLILSKK